MAKSEKIPKNFALTGVAGYITPRHLKAIKETGNKLIAALDPHDSVGILDSYFPEAKFFTEFERFDRYLDKLRRQNGEHFIHYVSICSPNYLHDAHVRFALRIKANAICEKPLVLNPWNLDALEELERENRKKVYNILQLRVHPSLVSLKNKIKKDKRNKKHQVRLTYITSRGSWYLNSWKGQIEKSGGLATNIGIHFFDLLIWMFGTVKKNEVHYSSPQKTCGFLELNKAEVQWYLSIDKDDLPNNIKHKGQSTYRSLVIDAKEVEFSNGFTDLHTIVYKNILKEKGFRIKDVRPSIILAYNIRNASITGPNTNTHPLGLKLK